MEIRTTCHAIRIPQSGFDGRGNEFEMVVRGMTPRVQAHGRECGEIYPAEPSIRAARRRRDRETDRGGEDATMRNESKNHRKYANIYSMGCRTGEESCGLERGRRDKAGGSIGSKDGLV
jgi:hypothetical protein